MIVTSVRATISNRIVSAVGCGGWLSAAEDGPGGGGGGGELGVRGRQAGGGGAADAGAARPARQDAAERGAERLAEQRVDDRVGRPSASPAAMTSSRRDVIDHVTSIDQPSALTTTSYIHTYILICTAPKIARTNLRRWKDRDQERHRRTDVITTTRQ